MQRMAWPICYDVVARAIDRTVHAAGPTHAAAVNGKPPASASMAATRKALSRYMKVARKR